MNEQSIIEINTRILNMYFADTPLSAILQVHYELRNSNGEVVRETNDIRKTIHEELCSSLSTPIRIFERTFRQSDVSIPFNEVNKNECIEKCFCFTTNSKYDDSIKYYIVQKAIEKCNNNLDNIFLDNVNVSLKFILSKPIIYFNLH